MGFFYTRFPRTLRIKSEPMYPSMTSMSKRLAVKGYIYFLKVLKTRLVITYVLVQLNFYKQSLLFNFWQ